MIPRATASRTSNFIVSNVLICSTALPDVYACALTASAASTASGFAGAGAGGDADAVGALAVDAGVGFTGPGRSSTLGFLGG